MDAIAAMSSGSASAAQANVGNSNSPRCRLRARGLDGDALAAQHRARSGRVSAHRLAAGVGHVLGAAQGHAGGLHHGRQNLFAGIDTQTVKRLLHIAQHAVYVQRQLHLAAGMARSAGFVRDFISVVPFRCLLGTCMFTCRRKEPPSSTRCGPSPSRTSDHS